MDTEPTETERNNMEYMMQLSEHIKEKVLADFGKDASFTLIVHTSLSDEFGNERNLFSTGRGPEQVISSLLRFMKALQIVIGDDDTEETEKTGGNRGH